MTIWISLVKGFGLQLQFSNDLFLTNSLNGKYLSVLNMFPFDSITLIKIKSNLTGHIDAMQQIGPAWNTYRKQCLYCSHGSFGPQGKWDFQVGQIGFLQTMLVGNRIGISTRNRTGTSSQISDWLKVVGDKLDVLVLVIKSGGNKSYKIPAPV